MKNADLLVRCLEQEGVEFVFGVPGEENLDFLDALSRSKVRFVLVRHEQAAGFMAATFGRLSGAPGVVLATLGPGATNLMTAAAYAQLGAMPLLMVTGQKPIMTSKQALFQIIDVVKMMAPITKYTQQIVSGDRLPAQVREAFRLAEEERPGAVHLELPEDVAAMETVSQPFTKSLVRRPLVEAKALQHAVQLLDRAQTPVLVIGAGANRKLTADALRELIYQHGIPFITTQMGKGIVDERHELFLGNAALSSGDFVHSALSHADVIVSVGHDIVEKPPFIMSDESDGPTVIHVDYSSAQVDPLYFPQVELVGDISNAVCRLGEALNPTSDRNYDGVLRARDALRKHVESRAADDRFPLLPQRVVADVREVVPEEGVIALDNGIYKLWFARNYSAYGPNTVLLDNALATMGAGLPSAIAAKLVDPSRPAVAICGDGGFLMNSQELETAVRLKLDLVVLVLRDDALGMIAWKQQHDGFADFGLSYGNPDLAAYATSYGATGHSIQSADSFSEALRAALDAGGVHLLDVPVDYSENNHIFHDEIPALARRFRV